MLAGPYCCYQLALLGADVIKVEAPGGDLARQLGAPPALNAAGMGASLLAQNAGKRSVVLDLKGEGRAAFLDLVATADVVVENFRPGVMDRLSLGYETLRAVRPDLVYCAIPGFGQTGPMRGNPAYDQIIQGLSGVMSLTGTPEMAPLRVGYPVCDTLGGLFGAFGAARPGPGCWSCQQRWTWQPPWSPSLRWCPSLRIGLCRLHLPHRSSPRPLPPRSKSRLPEPLCGRPRA